MPGQDHKQSPVQETARRGVYELPFRGSQGERLLVAVDRRGHRLFEASVFPGARDPGAITELLRAALDREDPAHLQIVR